ncbi:MAG: PD-(D/E)XK nuclease family protein [Bacteroidota bacterium]
MPVILYKNHPLVTDLQSEIHKRIANNHNDTFIYIVPTRRKVRELQRELLKIPANRTAPAFELFTLETFATELYSLFSSPKLLLSMPTQAVLFGEAIRNKEKELGYFLTHSSRKTIPAGTLKKMINVINSLKEAGIYPVDLYSELNNADNDEKQKLKDILLIYEEYESLIKEKFIDIGGIYKELNETISKPESEKLFRERFSKVTSIFIDGFDEFSDPEITMMDAISRFNNLGIVISFDYYLNNDELFGHLRENYEKFKKIGFRIKSDQDIITTGTDNHFRYFIARNLFRHDFVESEFTTDKISVFKAGNREEEVEYIAKIIKRLVNDNPSRDLSKICVAMYSPQLYTKLFHEIFPRYGIPSNITDRFQLDQSLAIVSIISLLKVWQNNFRRRDLMRALTNPYFAFENSSLKIDTGNLYSVSAALKINVGREFWKKRINNRLNQIQIEIESITDDFELQQREKEIISIKKALDDISSIEKLLQRFGPDMTPVQFKKHLSELLSELNIQQNIMKSLTFQTEDNAILTEQTEKDTRAYQKFLNVLDEIIGLLKFQNKDAIPQPLKFYINKLKEAVAQTRYNIRQKYGYGVYVTSLEETRGLDFEIMFIAGLVDGEFPSVYQPEIFLSKSRQYKKELYHLTENRYLFYQCITNFTEKLFLSYPNKDGELEAVPSSFVDSFLNIIKCNDWRKEIPSELNSAVYCEDELLQILGHNARIGIKQEIADKFDERIFQIIKYIYFAIRVEASRLTSGEMPEYRGLIFDTVSNHSREKLIKLKDKIFSISQLEKYAACPFQYFADNILRLTVIEELEEGMTPLERGSILHEVLYEFYTERRSENLPHIFECDQNQFDEALHKLIEITKRKLESLSQTDVFHFLEKELILGTEKRTGIIPEFLKNERNRKLDVVPSYYEVAFGPRVGNRQISDKLLDVREAIQVGNVKIRGKVDRVDTGENYFTTIDYKTGKDVPSLSDIIEGLSLQLPVYLYVIEKVLIKFEKALKPAAGAYYLLGARVEEKVPIGNKELNGKAFLKNKQTLLENDEALRDVINKSIQYVNDYVDAIAAGKFEITTEEKMEKSCRHCKFDKVCRKETILENN